MKELEKKVMIVKEESREPAKHLFNFQRDCIISMMKNPKQHIVIAEPGLGKGATSIMWAWAKCKATGKNKVLVITTASKTHVIDELKRNDFEQDADNFGGEKLRKTITTLETVSWDLLYKWVDAHKGELSRWVYIGDELQKSKAGISSRRGKAFLRIASATSDWTGYTATPGDSWIDFYAYFQACGLVRNKTEFKREFCKIQTFKGFPEIVGYYNEATLQKWWERISIAPDTHKMLQELPKANYDLAYFSRPRTYSKVLKTRQKLCSDGEATSEDYEDFLDNPSAVAHYLRQLCFTKEKEQWVADYLDGLGEQAFFFYNYVETGNKIEYIAYKVLPDGVRVWRIDGKNHIIPTKEMMGPRDIVLAQWQSGAEGLNYHFMREMVIAEPTYAYSTHKQGKGRILRIGQERPVFYHMLIARDTIEEDILKCIRDKKDFAEKTWLLSQKLN